MEKISIYLFVYFTYFPYFAGSGVAARTPRREQAEGETSLRQKLLFWKLFLTLVFAMANLMPPQDKCWRIGINRGGYKESIKCRETAGTFGRAFSPCEWVFWNVPFWLSLTPWIRLIYRALRLKNKVRHYWDIWQMSLFFWERKHRKENIKQRPRKHRKKGSFWQDSHKRGESFGWKGLWHEWRC